MAQTKAIAELYEFGHRVYADYYCVDAVTVWSLLNSASWKTVRPASSIDRHVLDCLQNIHLQHHASTERLARRIQRMTIVPGMTIEWRDNSLSVRQLWMLVRPALADAGWLFEAQVEGDSYVTRILGAA